MAPRTWADALVDAIHALNASGVRYFIAGGVARGLYGAPLLTKDLDVTVFTDLEGARRIFTPRFRQVAPDGFVDATGFGVDVFLPTHPEHGAMLERARRVPFADTTAWVADPTDWAALKLVEARRSPLEAGRHLTDIIIVGRQEPISMAALEALASAFGVREQHEALVRILDQGGKAGHG